MVSILCLIVYLVAFLCTSVVCSSPHRALIRPVTLLPVKVLNTNAILATTRGGAASDKDDEDLDDDDDDGDDDDLDLVGLDEGDFEIAEDDFAEENTVGRMVAAWEKTPPLTKAYLTASFAATGYGYLLNKNQFPALLSMNWKLTTTRLQLWRPITAFLNVGPFGLGYVMTVHFVWTYMGTLERLNHDRPYDFWIMIAFGFFSMVTGYGFLNMSPKFLGHNLSTYLVYIWSRYHEGLEVNMFELFNTKAELLPWFFLAQTFLLEGELPVLDFLGIVFGHIYHHCKTTGLLKAPDSLVGWYNSEGAAGIRKKYKQISADFEI